MEKIIEILNKLEKEKDLLNAKDIANLIYLAYDCGYKKAIKDKVKINNF